MGVEHTRHDGDNGGGGGLTPAQADVVALLGAPREEWPTFDPGLREHLRSTLHDGLAQVAEHRDLDEDRLWVGKFHLKEIHGCEAKFMADDSGFTPSVATVKGSVAHKAIELTVNLRGDPSPGELVDEAISRLVDAEQWMSDYLADLPDTDMAELRGEVNELVVKFQDCWPPLKAAWRPVAESKLYVDLHDGRITLAGKVDLSLGRAEGERAGKVLVDLKTGRSFPAHRDDLRFYALLEAVRIGVPPRRIATHYLDSGHLEVEDVTVDLLEAAAARTVDGAVALHEVRDPARLLVKRPGSPCGWCALAAGCTEGEAWLEAQDEA